jgi:RHS repeat-associated protein
VNQKFTGKERDVETGLDWFKVRYMGSPQGRFTSPDPFSPIGLKRDKFNAWIANPQRWNKYAYALNNPLVLIDPTGMNACGTNNDKDCKVTIVLTERSKDKNGNYNDNFTDVKNQKNYNATATVYVNGENKGVFLARTVPSDTDRFATVASGGYAGTNVTYHGRPSISLEGGGNLPTINDPNPAHPNQGANANGVLVHKAGIDNFTGIGRDGRAVSEGCQTIASSQYADFQSATGLVPAQGTPQQSFGVIISGAPNQRPPISVGDANLPDPGID